MCVFKIKPSIEKKTENRLFLEKVREKIRTYVCVCVRFCLGYNFLLFLARSLKFLATLNCNLYMCGFFRSAHELILTISKLLKWLIKNAKRSIFKTTCQTELTLKSKDAENQKYSEHLYFACCFLRKLDFNVKKKKTMFRGRSG